MLSTFLTALRSKDYAAAQSAFTTVMQQKVNARLSEERQTVMECGCMDENEKIAECGDAALTEGTDRGGWVTLKTITSHVGTSRFREECESDDVGWVKNPKHIPSPYSYSPSRGVYRWKGKNVILIETSHKRYEVIAVPASEHIYKTDDEATQAYVNMKEAVNAKCPVCGKTFSQLNNGAIPKHGTIKPNASGAYRDSKPCAGSGQKPLTEDTTKQFFVRFPGGNKVEFVTRTIDGNGKVKETSDVKDFPTKAAMQAAVDAWKDKPYETT